MNGTNKNEVTVGVDVIKENAQISVKETDDMNNGINETTFIKKKKIVGLLGVVLLLIFLL